jgi:hypothetical protein
MLRQHRPPMPLFDKLVELGTADFYDGKFGGNEKTVGKNNQKDKYEITEQLGSHRAAKCS